jgi:hypothetical protein
MSLSLINTLELLIIEINRWICPIILIFGLSGNILNLIIFTRQTFLKQSCSLYFLCISLNNITMYLIGLTTRIIDDGFQLNLIYNNTNIYSYFIYYSTFNLLALYCIYIIK